MSNIIGDSEGVKLWDMMSRTTDPSEKEYFERLSRAASNHGVVWFTDIVAERHSGKQPFFQLSWEQKNNQWRVSLFMIPEGATKDIDERHSEEINRNIDDCEEVDPEFVEMVEESLS